MLLLFHVLDANASERKTLFVSHAWLVKVPISLAHILYCFLVRICATRATTTFEHDRMIAWEMRKFNFVLEEICNTVMFQTERSERKYLHLQEAHIVLTYSIYKIQIGIPSNVVIHLKLIQCYVQISTKY